MARLVFIPLCLALALYIGCGHAKPVETAAPAAAPKAEPQPLPPPEPAVKLEEKTEAPAALAGLGEFAEYFPEKVEGWAPKDTAVRTEADLAEVAGGEEEEAFRENGFVKAAVVTYEDPAGPGQIISVAICDMGKPQGAFGLYSSQRPAEATFAELGGEGFQAGNEIKFWKDLFFARLTANDKVKDPDALYRIGRRIDGKLPYGEGEVPELELLPWEEKIARTEMYYPKATMGYRFLSRGVSAAYRFGGKGQSTIFISIFEDYKASQDAFKEFVKLISSKEKPLPLKCSAKEAFAGADPEKGQIVIFRHLNYIGGIKPAPAGKKAENEVDVIVARLPQK